MKGRIGIEVKRVIKEGSKYKAPLRKIKEENWEI